LNLESHRLASAPTMARWLQSWEHSWSWQGVHLAL